MKDNKIPSPWIPVKVTEDDNGYTVNVWGRNYSVKDDLLFSSVTSLNEELLAEPIRISASENGNPIEWTDKAVFLSSATDEKATIYSTAQSEAFIVNTSCTVEFDGLATVDIKLMPRGYTVPQLFGLEKKEPAKTNLDYFHVEIPLKKEIAKLYHLYPNNIMPDATGNTGNSDMYSGSGFLNSTIFSGFSSVVFLGNDEKGFFTYAESDKNWQSKDKKKAIEIINQEDCTLLKLNLIDGMPKVWEKINCEYGQYDLPDICFRLFFQASPVKAYPDNPYDENRLHIDCFKKISGDYLEFLENPVVEGSDEIGFDRIKRLGVTTLILHEKWNQVQNYWKLTKKTSEQAKKIISECHKRGIKVVPYFGYEISSMADIWYDKSEVYKKIGNDAKTGLGWYRFPAQREMPVCYNSPIADELASGIEKLVDEYDFDGIYLDGTAMVWGCKNTSHGCGYYDDEGVLHPTYPILAVRNLLKRLYSFFESRNKTINCHVSDCFSCAGLSFSHLLWVGEYIQYGLVKYGATEMPEGYLRATHSGRNFGIPAEFIVYENDPIWTFDDAFAFSLINGVLPRPNDIGKPLEKMSRIWDIVNSFPIGNSSWCPYFDDEKMHFKSSDNQIKISYYKHSGDDSEKYLIFISNSKVTEVNKCCISGLDGISEVINAYTNEKLPVNDGKIQLDFGRFGHYILKTEKI